MTAILPWQRKQDGITRAIKRNEEFARWWNSWTSRIQRSRAHFQQGHRMKGHANRINPAAGTGVRQSPFKTHAFKQYERAIDDKAS